MKPEQYYRIFGLNVASELPLALPAAAAQDQVDVEVSFGAVEPVPEGTVGYAVSPLGTVLAVEKVARYRVSGGRKVVIDPAPAVSERNLRLFLLGSAFGALLHQRGLLPLHANAIDLGGRAVAFSGHSGAGKSTLAAWFHDRGHAILSDDVCVISADPERGALAFPGIPRLRLWREALEASGRRAGEYERSFDDQDKFDVPTRSEDTLEPVPLAAVYLLEKCGEGECAGIEPIRGAAAVDVLVSNTYRGAYVPKAGKTSEHFAACVKLAQRVPVFRARRSWGFEEFEQQALRLLEHAEALQV